jgi:hypothetical protein
MKMSDKTYNKLKYFLMIFYPALTLLISTLGSIYNFDVEKILLTISAIVTFIGTITGISNIKYNKEKGE